MYEVVMVYVKVLSEHLYRKSAKTEDTSLTKKISMCCWLCSLHEKEAR